MAGLHLFIYNIGSGDGTSPSNPMRVLPRENDMRQFFREGGFSGNPEMYAFNHYKSLLGNTEWVSAVGKCFLNLLLTKSAKSLCLGLSCMNYNAPIYSTYMFMTVLPKSFLPSKFLLQKGSFL